jgi:hypothetical protein
VCRQKQRNYSGVQSDRTRNVTYGCERTGCEAKALQRCLRDEVPSITRCQVSSRAGFGREFDEPIALPNERYAPHDFGSAANAF